MHFKFPQNSTNSLKKNYIILFLFLNGILTLIGLLLIVSHFFKSPDPNLVYIDVNQVFNKFHLSQDLRAINQKKVVIYRKQLDSLYTIYSIFQQENNLEMSKEYEVLLQKENIKFQDFNDSLVQSFNKQIWARLDQYIEEFRLTNDYKIILAKKPHQNMIYAEESKNITKDLLVFINNRYEGISKESIKIN